MKIYIGNIQHLVDCDQLISNLKKHQVEPFNGFIDLPTDHPSYNDLHDQHVLLSNVGYDETTVEFRHYDSGVHYDNSVMDAIGTLTNSTPLFSWISEIRPGKCAPWHWDVNPWEQEQKQLGTLVRYFCFLSKPAPGHIFVTEHDAYYNEPQGSIYQYQDIHSWHAGSNVGLVPKFLLTFTGYKKI